MQELLPSLVLTRLSKADSMIFKRLPLDKEQIAMAILEASQEAV